MREFWCPTTVIAAPVRCWGSVPAEILSGTAGTHFAQTLCFPGFHASPQSLLQSASLFAQILLPTAVSAPLFHFLNTSRARVRKTTKIYNSAKSISFYNSFCVWVSKTTVISLQNRFFAPPKCIFDTLAAVL